MKSKKPRPLVTIGRPPKAEVYRVPLRAFESTKYLNVAALQKARKAVIEIGSIEAAGVKAIVAAEVHKGLITKVRPLGWEGYARRKTKTRTNSAAFKRVALEALKRTRALGQPMVKLPIPVTSARIRIPIWPHIIIIIYTEPWFDICIVIEGLHGKACEYCLFGPSICG